MNCKLYILEMEEAASGATLSREARAHLAACRRCLDFYEERASLNRLVGELERVAAPPDFEFRLRARMAGAKSLERSPWLRSRFVPGLVSITLAACFALVVATSIFLRRETTSQPVAQVPSAPVATSPAVVPFKSERADAVQTTLRVERSEPVEIKPASAKIKSQRRLSTMNEPGARPKRLDVEAQSVNFINADVKGASISTRGEVPSNFEVPGRVPPVAITVSSSADPLRVVLRDERGGVRYVSMKPVSFGAQDSVGRLRERATARLADKEGIW
ncbi:MAG: hypothetical protein LC754_15285 [Acidobacteria bacterium]|nr:hypothetical protein [Acidobacteriota bacterium]